MDREVHGYTVTAPSGPLQGKIRLPSSKSISNRLLILGALSQTSERIDNLSASDDTRVMEEAFRSGGPVIDVGHAGTAMRFLTAYLAITDGDWVLTGSERMKQRPVGILVDALTQLGARIEYAGKKGFPPLLIKGSPLSGGTVVMDGSVSSQYISAMLMIAPTLKGGLTLRLVNRITSRSYIRMTLQLMQRSGIRHEWITGTAHEIRIPEQPYHPGRFTVEADWSAAGYWYEMLALAPGGEMELTGARLSGLQGDESIAGWSAGFGIHTRETVEGIVISKKKELNPPRLFLKFHENPDLAQTMAALCVGKKIPFHFLGLETLKIKETNRIAALTEELAKFGARLTEPGEGQLKWDGTTTESLPDPVLETYGDHRMAMALAPLSLTGNPVTILDPGVVSKSYPRFWEDLIQSGFIVTGFPPPA